MKNYLLNFLIGGILTALLYYYSNKNNTIMSSIIVSIPIFFIIGYIFICNNNGNLDKYITNTMVIWTMSVIFLIIIYLTLMFIDNKILSLIIGNIFFILLLYYFIEIKIIV